jgi:hypothetical protein
LAKAIVTVAGLPEEIDQIEDVSMTAPYWMIKLKSGEREFFHFDTVTHVRIEGEEELIQAAQAKKQQGAQIANQLGLEA